MQRVEDEFVDDSSPAIKRVDVNREKAKAMEAKRVEVACDDGNCSATKQVEFCCDGTEFERVLAECGLVYSAAAGEYVMVDRVGGNGVEVKRPEVECVNSNVAASTAGMKQVVVFQSPDPGRGVVELEATEAIMECLGFSSWAGTAGDHPEAAVPMNDNDPTLTSPNGMKRYEVRPLFQTPDKSGLVVDVEDATMDLIQELVGVRQDYITVLGPVHGNDLFWDKILRAVLNPGGHHGSRVQQADRVATGSPSDTLLCVPVAPPPDSGNVRILDLGEGWRTWLPPGCVYDDEHAEFNAWSQLTGLRMSFVMMDVMLPHEPEDKHCFVKDMTRMWDIFNNYLANLKSLTLTWATENCRYTWMDIARLPSLETLCLDLWVPRECTGATSHSGCICWRDVVSPLTQLTALELALNANFDWMDLCLIVKSLSALKTLRVFLQNANIVMPSRAVIRRYPQSTWALFSTGEYAIRGLCMCPVILLGSCHLDVLEHVELRGAFMISLGLDHFLDSRLLKHYLPKMSAARALKSCTLTIDKVGREEVTRAFKDIPDLDLQFHELPSPEATSTIDWSSWLVYEHQQWLNGSVAARAHEGPRGG